MTEREETAFFPAFSAEGEKLIAKLARKKRLTREQLIALALEVADETKKDIAVARSLGHKGTLVRDGVPDLLRVLDHVLEPDILGVPEGLEPTERRLWIPEDEQLRPQWLNTSRSALLLAQQLIEDGRLLSEMDWRAFEKLIAELLERDGWSIHLMRGTKDGGIDVVSTRADPAVGVLKAVWQAKRYGDGHKVQLSHARELSGVVERERASKGVLVTTTSLTRGALDWVKQDEFRLSAKDGDEVRRWIEKYAD